MMTPLEFSELSIKDQKKLLNIYDKQYYIDDYPTISDALYDNFKNIYLKTAGIEEYEYVPGIADDKFKKYKHIEPILSLGKITNTADLQSIIKKFENNYIAQPKIDGLTVVMYPDGKMVSRGNGLVGEELPFANQIPFLPKPIDKPVRMEMFIKRSIFKYYFADSNKNSRNTVAGILRRKEYSNDIRFISYYAYNIIGSEFSESDQLNQLFKAGFVTIPELCTQKLLDGNILVESWENSLKDVDYDTDGVVIKYNGKNGLQKFGSTSHHPNNMIAYKFISDIAVSKLRDIEWSEGRDGLTPVAIFDSVELGGTTVSRASVHNINIINELNLKIGSEIVVTKKNEIIPQIIGSNGIGDNIIVPIKCPVCDSDLKINSIGRPYCTNNDCGIKYISTIKKICSREGLDIDGISESTIKQILKYKHFTNPFEFLELISSDFELCGFTKYSSVKFAGAIVKAKNNVKLEKFLYSCDINLLGKSLSRLLAKKYQTIDNFLSHFVNDLENDNVVEGIGLITKTILLDNFKKIKENFKYIASWVDADIIPVPTTKYKFAITGTLEQPRKYYVNLIESHGHEFAPSISKSVNYLITGDKSGAKLDKAAKYGIEVISEDKLKELLGE